MYPRILYKVKQRIEASDKDYVFCHTCCNFLLANNISKHNKRCDGNYTTIPQKFSKSIHKKISDNKVSSDNKINKRDINDNNSLILYIGIGLIVGIFLFRK